jgi:hypothetical protein
MAFQLRRIKKMCQTLRQPSANKAPLKKKMTSKFYIMKEISAVAKPSNTSLRQG